MYNAPFLYIQMFQYSAVFSNISGRPPILRQNCCVTALCAYLCMPHVFSRSNRKKTRDPSFAAGRLKRGRRNIDNRYLRIMYRVASWMAGRRKQSEESKLFQSIWLGELLKLDPFSFQMCPIPRLTDPWC
jgi:hypothetical protein